MSNRLSTREAVNSCEVVNQHSLLPVTLNTHSSGQDAVTLHFMMLVITAGMSLSEQHALYTAYMQEPCCTLSLSLSITMFLTGPFGCFFRFEQVAVLYKTLCLRTLSSVRNVYTYRKKLIKLSVAEGDEKHEAG